MIRNSKLKIFFLYFFFGFTCLLYAKPVEKIGTKKTNDPLIIFHVDLNSVALKESYLRKWLKDAAGMGYNAVLWEVEGKIKWKTCPECVDKDAFSIDTFKKILAYSKSLGLQPIPLLQTIGHAEYVLRHKKYYSFREDTGRYDCYAICKPEVRKFIKDWIKEYLNIFGGIKYFHLGGDEAYVFAKSPECASKVKEEGKGKLYAEYMKDIAGQLTKKGIRPCIWGDMIMHYPDAIRDIPKNFVMWDWNYWDGDNIPSKVMVWNKGNMFGKNAIDSTDLKNFPEIIDKNGNLNPFYTSDVFKRLGYDVILSSSSRSYGDAVFAGRQELHVSNIIGAAKKVVHDNLLGTCVTSWAVRIPNYETQATWLYLAPLAIKYSDLTHDELLSKSFENIFGITNNELIKGFDAIGFPFPFVDQKSTGIMWTGMKDSRPTPPDYINHLIATWKKNNSGEQWKENIRLIRSAPNKIAVGMDMLNKFFPKATKGLDILQAWEKAGYFQYMSALFANYIVDSVEEKPMPDKREIISLLEKVKSDYNHWANYWMTPNSAEINTGLIYDAIIDYFSKTDK